MKVSDAPFERVEPYLDTGLDIFIGVEPLIPRGLARGGVGACGTRGRVPEAVTELVNDPTPERAARAEALRSALSAHTLPAAVKTVLAPVGSRSAPTPVPDAPAAGDEAKALRAAIERVEGPLRFGLTAHHEHTIVIMRNEPIVLATSVEGLRACDLPSRFLSTPRMTALFPTPFAHT